MKKITFIIVLMILACNVLFAWDLSRQTQFPTTFTAMSKGGSSLWAVGSGGAVVKSTDNGNNWQFVPNPAFSIVNSTYVQLNAVSFSDNLHGIVAGNDGTAFYTSDGGQNWTSSSHILSVFVGNDIKSAWYLPSGKIVVAGEGGVIAYSDNHGATFTNVPSPVGSTINTIYMEESGMIFIGCGSAVVQKSENFGANWTALPLGNANNPNIYSIKRQGTRLLLTGNKGYVGYSDDNGTNWTHHNNLGSNAVSIYDTAWNGTIGYAVANNGFIVSTSNNFETVNVISTYFTDATRGAYFNESNDLIATAAYGTLMKWDAVNQAWVDLVVNAYDLYSVAVGNDQTWYVCGDRAILYKTTDNGQNYSRITVPGEKVSFNAMKFFDANTGLVTGKTTGKIFKTVNGGQDWTSFTVPNVGTKLFRDFAFINDQIGYAIGSMYNSKTTDGGATWTTPTNTGIGTTTSLYSGYFKNENTGFAGGSAGAVYVTTDGAQNWTTFTLGNKIITDIFFIDDNNGFILTEATVSGGAVTQAGKLFRTSTGGMTASDWAEVTLPAVVGTLNGITRTEDGTLYIAGYSNNLSQQGTNWAILKSTDNGINWTEETLPSLTFNPTQFRAIDIKGNKIVACGSNQLVMGETLENDDEIYATDLFISEYIEGSSNNKAIEIFNGTGQTVDLSNYSVKLGANGNAWGNNVTLNGTLAHGSVYIIANSGSNATILALADTTSNVTFYNGDDALGLFNGTTLIDVFGTYQLDPGTAWAVAGVDGATVNHTLIRKPTVISPTTDWSLSAGTDANNSQWTVYDIDYLTDLGMHTFSPVAPTSVSAPTFTPAPGTFYAPVDISINCATENANIFYTTDGTDPSDLSTPYTGSINIATTTTIKAIAYATGMTPSSISTATYTITLPIEVSNISALRNQEVDNTIVYKLTGEAIITFIQSYRNQKYIQDATAAIIIDDLPNILATQYNLYDGITGITGKLNIFGGMLQFSPILAGAPASSTNNTITPQVITINQFNTSFEDYEAELVKIENVQFTATGNFVNGTVYDVISGSDTLAFRSTFYDVNYIGDPIPTGSVSIVGICNSRTDGNYFTARDSSDFTVLVANPPQNLVYTMIENNVNLAWEAPIAGSSGTLNEYKIYRNNVLLGNVPANTLTYSDITTSANQSYTYYVTASYINPNLESIASNQISVTIAGETLYPPLGLNAMVIGDDVTLNWQAAGPVQTWITHADDVYDDAIGTNSAATFSVAQRFTNAQLTNLGVVGSQITKVRFMAHEPAATYTVKVWTGGTSSPYAAGTVAATQAVPSINVDDWTEVILTTPVTIPATGEVWFGYDINTPSGYPAGADAGPALNGFGNMMYWQNAWTTLTALAATLDYNWIIQAYATEGAGRAAKYISSSIVNNQMPIIPIHPQTDVFKSINVTRAQSSRNDRSLLGYKVYRGTTLLTPTALPTTTLTYTDENLANGEYTYNVTALYTEGESAPATVTATVNVGGGTITTFPWNEGFEGATFPPANWANIDNDGDTNLWFSYAVAGAPHGGTKCAGSASWAGGVALTPDNWLITPKIELPTFAANQTAYLRFWIAAQDPDWPQEHYSVMISTTDTNIASFTSVLSETLQSDDWVQKSIALNNYSNQDIYIAFRHHAVTDMFYIKLDDVLIELGQDASTPVAKQTKLGKNYPNPFNPSTSIAYSLKERTQVSVEVFNIKGQKVRTLVNEVMNAGDHSIVWNGKDDHNNDAGSGVYFYRMTTPNYTSTGKMILVK